MTIPGHSYVRAQILRRGTRGVTADWSRFDVIALPTAETVAPSVRPPAVHRSRRS